LCNDSIANSSHTTRESKDNIELKNLVREAEKRLTNGCDQEKASVIIDKINDLASDIDYRFNLESLILFANEDVAEYIRMPIHIQQNKVTIGKTFATRDLVRALHQELDYYILVLSRDKARLIEALSDKEVAEITDGFPVENTFRVPETNTKLESSQVLEFFNRVDKQLNETQKGNDLPVFISTDESNYSEYLKVADRKETVKGLVAGNRDMANARNIIDAVWPVAKKWNEQKSHQRLEELDKAVGAKLFLIDPTEIWRAILEGRGRTLFVKQGYFQPAKVENNVVQTVSSDDAENANVEDIIDDMIEKNIDFGGDAVFVSGDELKAYDGLVLVTRY